MDPVPPDRLLPRLPLRRRMLARAAGAGLLATFAARSARAASPLAPPGDFPKRPIEFLVAYPPGGGMDATARLLARYFEKHTGHTVVVVNKAGAAGAIGEAFMATQAPADGTMVGIMASNFWSNSHLKSDGKWSYRNTDPIAFVALDPLAWLVSEGGPHGDLDLKAMLELGRRRPDTISVAGSSSTASGFLLDQVQTKSGARFVPVQYQGGRQAVTDLMGGHIAVSYGYYAEYRALLEAGKVSVLAVSSARRLPTLPDVPTFNEVLGTDDILWDAFRFAAVPGGVPENRKRWLAEGLGRALDDPEFGRELAVQGGTLDRSLDTPTAVAREVHRRADLERDYLIRTGHLAR